MRIAATKPLFAWDCLEDSPSLSTIALFLRLLPDGKLLRSLRQARGRGRNDYRIASAWGVLLLTILLRHPSIEACLADLRRNAALRRLIGIERESKVPNDYNMSRFLTVLGSEPPAVSQVRPMTPAALDHVVRLCLAKDPRSGGRAPGTWRGS